MVAVIAGNGLGLGNTSLQQLGQGLGGQAAIGQDGVGQYVNAANGNLVLQTQDENLIFDGLSLNVLRTYNSQGQLAANGGWGFGFSRSVGGLTGTLDTAGSTVTRTDDDGSAVTYTYNATLGEYVSSGQSGAADTLSWNATASTWTWNDAAAAQQETYSASGQLTTLSDAQTGASYSFSYTSAHQLSQIVAGDGDTLLFGYNTSGQLTSLSVQEVPPGQTTPVTRQQVGYGYDTQGRLSTITTTLGSDTDSSTASYTTTYTYSGTSDRIASVTQSDGTTVSYSYTEDAQGVYQVTGITTGTGAAAQTLTLAYTSGSTTVTNALGNTTTYQYNAAGELTAVIAPTVNGTTPTTSYTYDTHGNLLTSTDPDGATTSYSYDANGNLLSVEDGAGNTRSYTYNANDQVTSQTTYTVPAQGTVGQSGYVAPSGAQTTYYVYNAADQRAYVIDPLGNVTQNTYSTTAGISVLGSTQQYLGASFSLTGLSPSTPPTLAALQSWVASSAVQNTLSQSTLTSYTYDVRGQLATQTQWDTVSASGTGVSDAGTVVTTTTYSAQGQLLQTATQRGSTLQTTAYAYDGLGRLISRTDPLGNVTSYVYTGGTTGATLAITQANGLTTTQATNSAGQLISSTQSASGLTSRVTTYVYNADGQQIEAINPEGTITYTFYNAVGEVAGTVDPDGDVTAYTYDGDGHTIATTQYATPLTAAQLSALTGSTAWSSVQSEIVTSANDRTAHVLYNAAGLAVATIDPEGNVTTTTYDGDGHPISTTAYATALTGAQLTALGSAPTLAALQADLTASTNDRTTQTIYDADGRAVATINAAGDVTTQTYNAAGDVVLSTAYATALTTAQHTALGSNPTLTALQADLTASSANQVTSNYYDATSRLVAQVDADGYLTTTTYNQTTNTTTTTRYATALTAAQLSALTPNESAATLVGLLGSNTANEQSSVTDNADGQVASSTAIDGTVTTYAYNSVGQLLTTTVTPTAGQGAARTTRATYDAFGDTLTTVDGNQATTTYSYNVLGQRISATDADGNSTYTYYDADGRVLYTVQGQPSGSSLNVLGNVTSYSYNAFGQVASTQQYASQLTLTGGTSSGTTLNPATATLAQVATAVAALPVSASDANGLTTYTYTLDGQVASLTNGDGYQTAYGYDAFGDQIQVQQQLSAPGSALSASNSTLTQATYNALGEQVDQTQGVGSTVASSTSSTYDAFGRLSSSTDGNGNTITYGYDNLGRQVSTSQTVQGTARTTQTSYNAFDQVLTQTDALGNVTRYQYTPATHTSVVTTPDGVTMTTVKDAYGDTVSVTDGAGDTTRYTYDADGRLLTTTDALGNVSSNAYDADGDVIQTTDATGHLVTYTYNASGRVLTQTVDPAGPALTTTYAYDGEGRELSVTDPTGTVTTYAYDADGNTLTQVQDAGAGHLNLTTTSTYDGEGKTLTVTLGAGTSAARTTQYVYDNLERLSQQIVDPGTGHLNLTTSYTYDANNNLTSVTNADGNVTRSVYDQANEKIFSIDPTGAVTQMWYDADGQVTSIRSYATALTSTQLTALGTAPSIAAVTADLVTSTSDRVSYTAYNTDGQVGYTIDPMGNVTETRYDAAGRVSETLAYAQAVSVTVSLSTALQQGTAMGSMASAISAAGNTDANAEATLRLYDADGHTRFVVQQNTVNGQLVGLVSEQRYDAAGRVIASIAYGSTLPLSSSAALTAQLTTASVTAAVASAPSEMTQSVYDNAGRLRYTINSLDQVTENRYDNDRRVTETLVYPGAITVPATLTLANVAQAVVAANTIGYIGSNPVINERYATTTYDAVGRVVNTGDWNGINASYTYDATGLQLTQTNRDGNQTVITYDKAGRKILVQSPQVEVASDNGSGVLQAPTWQYLYTSYSYDAMGNVTTLNQGSGSSPSTITNLSTTTYTYDADGRQTQAAYLDGVPPYSTRTFYNTFGQTVVTEDGNFNYQYNVYNLDGEVAYAVDADGYVTGVSHDAYGNTAAVTQYATALNTGAITGWSAGQPLTMAQLQQGLVTSSSDRTTTTTYDQRNQMIEVQQSAIAYALGQNNGATQAPTQPTTTYTYDAYGNQTSSSTLLQGSSATKAPTVWATSYTYYDALNRVVMVITPTGLYTNPQGYVSQTSYDGFGEVSSTTQYANAIATGAVTTAAPPSTPVTSSYDRTNIYSYDHLGRVTTETSTGTYSDVGGTAGIATGSSVTSYTYNGENQVTSVDVNGATTTTAYDAAGRVISVTAPARQALVSNWATLLESTPGDDLTSAALYTTVSPVTSYVYDALGHALSTTTSTGLQTRQTFATYDSRGNVLSYTDTAGNVQTNTYDRDGHLLTQSYLLTSNGASSTVTTAYVYDKDGQLTTTSVKRSGQSTYDSYTQTQYDAFGEVVAQGDNNGFEAQYTYNNVGNLISATDPTTGAIHTYQYDLAGHQITNMTVSGQAAAVILANSSDADDESFQQIVTTDTSDAAWTINTINLGGQILHQITAGDSSLNDGQEVQLTHDRWGNVTSITDGDGNVTQYVYDAQNQLIHEIEPEVTVVSAAGVSSTAAPTKSWYYNVMGQLIGTTDENGNQTWNTYDAAGNLISTSDPASGDKTYTAYTSIGMAVAQETPPVNTATGTQSHITTTSYNMLGQVTGVGDFLLNAAGTARTAQQQETYVLNSNGDRIQVTDALGNTTTYTYDSQHRVLQSQTALQKANGQSQTYAYDVNGNLIKETDADGHTQSWVYNYFGQMLSHVDESGATYTYTYNPTSGLLATETSNWTANGPAASVNTTLNFEYMPDGQLEQLSQTVGGVSSTYTYQYDANGNETQEVDSTQDGSGQAVVVTTKTTYDSHNRISSVVESSSQSGPASDNMPTLTTDYTYDAVGNRREVTAVSGTGSGTGGTVAEWFTYDKDNRVLVTNGSLVSGQIVVTSAASSGQTTYDAAGDVSVYTTVNASGQTLSQKNSYDVRGELTMVQTQSTPGGTYAPYETRSYDADGNLISDVTYNLPGHQGAGTLSNGTLVSFSDAGWVTSDTIYTYNASGELTDESLYAENTAQNLINLYGTGVATSAYATQDAAPPSTLPTVGSNTDGALFLATETSYANASGGFGYDAAGNLLGYKTITTSNLGQTARTDSYLNSYVLQNTELNLKTAASTTSGTYQPSTNTNTYNDLGEVSEFVATVSGVAQTHALAYTADGQILVKDNLGTSANEYAYAEGQRLVGYNNLGDINLQNTTSGFSNSVLGSQDYTVQAGDTLQSLAQAIYGDASYAYILAQANGLQAGASLVAGMMLKIPQVTTSSNAATTFQPYSQSAILDPSSAATATTAQLVTNAIASLLQQQALANPIIQQIESEQAAEAAAEAAAQAAAEAKPQTNATAGSASAPPPAPPPAPSSGAGGAGGAGYASSGVVSQDDGAYGGYGAYGYGYGGGGYVGGSGGAGSAGAGGGSSGSSGSSGAGYGGGTSGAGGAGYGGGSSGAGYGGGTSGAGTGGDYSAYLSQLSSTIASQMSSLSTIWSDAGVDFPGIDSSLGGDTDGSGGEGAITTYDPNNPLAQYNGAGYAGYLAGGYPDTEAGGDGEGQAPSTIGYDPGNPLAQYNTAGLQANEAWDQAASTYLATTPQVAATDDYATYTGIYGLPGAGASGSGVNGLYDSPSNQLIAVGNYQFDPNNVPITQPGALTTMGADGIPTIQGFTVTASVSNQLPDGASDTDAGANEANFDYSSLFGTESATQALVNARMDTLPGSPSDLQLLQQIVATGSMSSSQADRNQAMNAEIQLEGYGADYTQPINQGPSPIVKISTDASGTIVLGVSTVSQANQVLRSFSGFSAGDLITSDEIGNIAQPVGPYSIGPNPPVNLSVEDLQANAQAAFSGNGGTPIASVVVASPWLIGYAQASGQAALNANQDLVGQLGNAYGQESDTDNPADRVNYLADIVNNALQAPAYALQYRYDVYAPSSGSGNNQVVVTAYGVDMNGNVYAYHPFLSQASQLLNQAN